MSGRRIEYFYSAHSAFAYLGARRLMEICAAHGATLVHRPIRLSPVVEAAGGRPFRERTQGHVDYYFGREIERWAEWRGAPVVPHRPTWHDEPLDLPNGFLIAAAEAGADVEALSFAVLEAHWRRDANLADPDHLAEAARVAGVDPAPLLAAALSDDVRNIHESNTAEAIRRGVPGSPTYFLGEEMFYGQDRLEMLERALVRPFAPPAFRNPRVGGA